MNWKRLIIYLHITSLILLIIDIYLLFNKNLSYRGFWTDKILIWIVLLSGLFVINKYKSTYKVVKIYMWIWISGLFFSLVPFYYPFLILISILFNTGDCIYTKNENVRIQSPYISFGGRHYDVVKELGMFDYTISKIDDDDFDTIKKEYGKSINSLEIKEQINDTLLLKINHIDKSQTIILPKH